VESKYDPSAYSSLSANSQSLSTNRCREGYIQHDHMVHEAISRVTARRDYSLDRAFLTCPPSGRIILMYIIGELGNLASTGNKTVFGRVSTYPVNYTSARYS
jgi:hypothetical protein